MKKRRTEASVKDILSEKIGAYRKPIGFRYGGLVWINDLWELKFFGSFCNEIKNQRIYQ